MKTVNNQLYDELATSSVYNIAIKRGRKNTRTFVCISACFFLTTVIFMSMYFSTQAKQQKALTDEYYNNIEQALTTIKELKNNQFDSDTKYRDMVGTLACVRSFCVQANQSDSNVTTITNIYYIAVKMPDQFTLYIDDIYDSFSYILNNKSKNPSDGYEKLNEIIEKVDRMDY